MDSNQTPSERFREFGERLAGALEGLHGASVSAGQTMAVQGAMGWAMRGDLVQARAALERVPAERLAEVAAAAAMLGSLAEELMAGGNGGSPRP